MAWKRGPLPKDTYFWGGVVKAGDDSGSGFYFADFQGDHVTIFPGDDKLTADQVAWYDNSLELPPVEGVKGRVSSEDGFKLEARPDPGPLFEKKEE